MVQSSSLLLLFFFFFPFRLQARELFDRESCFFFLLPSVYATMFKWLSRYLNLRGVSSCCNFARNLRLLRGYIYVNGCFDKSKVQTRDTIGNFSRILHFRYSTRVFIYFAKKLSRFRQSLIIILPIIGIYEYSWQILTRITFRKKILNDNLVNKTIFFPPYLSQCVATFPLIIIEYSNSVNLTAAVK